MTSNPGRPVGQLFTHAYVDRSTPSADSALFRQRLGGLCTTGTLLHLGKQNLAGDLAQYIKEEMGFTVPWTYHFQFDQLFSTVDIKYVLNLVTIVWRFLNTAAREYQSGVLTPVKASTWLEFVRRVIREENLHYHVDDGGGVHYSVDQEFEHNRISVLACLQRERYSGVRVAFEAAFTYLDANPSDTKAAVRAIFESVEILAKLMTGAQRLNRKLVEIELTDRAVKAERDVVAKKASTELIKGFAGWVDASHNYRHGQGVADPVEPPIDLAVYLISSGSAFLRWLVKIDSMGTAS